MREVDYLKSLLAQERGCAECWKGVACGKDCHMLDVAALPQPRDLLAQAVRACEASRDEMQSTIGERLRAKGYADVPSSSAHKHHANTAAPAACDSRKLSEIVPTTWLDPMLTGPNAALTPGVYYNDNDIERLLSAVKKRIEDAEAARDAARAAP